MTTPNKELTHEQMGLVKLLMRSPKDEDGWAKVSKILWKSVQQWCVPELIELEPVEDAGRARFTQEGQKIVTAIEWGLS